MNLDDFKSSWIANDRQLDDTLRLNLKLHALGGAETALQRHQRFVVIELILNVLLLLAVGSFVGDHLAEPRFLLPALVLHLAAIALTAACVRQIVLISGIDYSEPLISIQTRVERLNIERIRMTQWTFISAPLLWTPLLIVSLKALLGLDAWAVLDPTWLFANVLFGIVFLGVMLWAARHAASRFPHSPRLQRLADDLSDRSLLVARKSLDDAAKFAND